MKITPIEIQIPKRVDRKEAKIPRKERQYTSKFPNTKGPHKKERKYPFCMELLP
jgi:hypothetical protein